MKKLIALLSIINLGLALNSCDYVSNVTEGSSTNNGNGGTDTTENTIIYRKVLVEDYTGHKCGNCPAAAEELHRIDLLYHNKIIPMAVHAGGFANINSTYPTDLRTTDGTTYDVTFGISANGNPNGLINRKSFGTSDFISGYTLWETKASPMMQEEADFEIEINNTYNAGSNQVTSAVTVKANKDVSGKFNLSVLIVEDSIIGEQLDYRLPSGQQIIPDYVFMHVLRGSLNTTWGEQILDGSWIKGDSIAKTYSNYQLSGTMVAKNCHIIAFVYNADTGSSSYYEVMQAEDALVKP